MEVAEILAVTLIFCLADVAEWGTGAREVLHMKKTVLGINAAYLVIRACRYVEARRI